MDDALSLDGRAAIVTGAGNGLGRAEALALAAAGGRLVPNDLATHDVRAGADEVVAPVAAGVPQSAAARAGIARLSVTRARGGGGGGVRATPICRGARAAMTVDLMGAAPEGAVDPLAPEHVAPLVVYLASPAGAGING